MKYSLIVLLALAACSPKLSPPPSTDKISQLVSVENYFAAAAKEKGVKKAFLNVSDENTIVFRPGPVSAVEFYKSRPDSSGYLSWEPAFARIAKSNDWGFTTGPFTYKESMSSEFPAYGDYLSIWKKNTKGVWKLALDIGITHKKPATAPKLFFANPQNDIYQKQHSDTRLQQREDIVFSSDKLMSTVLKADNLAAQTEFLTPECRLLFPGFETIIGKANITEFWRKQGLRMTSEPIKADRAISGELAYTYGEAQIVQKNKIKKFNYVRIWEVQPGYVWNVIFEVYAEKL